jgi:hypothetical protein
VDELSIGDYVLSGGEVAAMVVVEAVVRLLPGVIGNPESLVEESYGTEHDGLLEGPVLHQATPLAWAGRAGRAVERPPREDRCMASGASPQEDAGTTPRSAAMTSQPWIAPSLDALSDGATERVAVTLNRR